MKFFFQNNVAYTRGALLALFAGLFILAACGNTVNINNNPAPPPTQTCADNPYGADCTVAQKKAAVDLCRTAIEDGESCATNTPAAVVSCLTDPFGADCTSAEDTAGIVKDLIDDKVIVIKDEKTRVLPTVQDDCEATPTQGSCPSVLSAIKEACDANPFDMLCTADTDYDDARRDACLGAAKDTILSESCRTNTLAEGVCEANPFAHTGCDNLTAIGGYRTTYCTTGTTTVFETTCGAFNGSEIVAGTNDARRDACLGAAKDTILSESCKTNTLAEGVCEANPFAHTGCENLTANPGYRTTYCTTNTATIFESDCGDADLYGATNAARGEACLAGYAGEGSNNCGDEDMAGTYIKAYCATDAGNTDITNCPKKYAGANPDVDTVIAGGLTGKALNATGTGLERVVASGGANTAEDDRANFIVGDTDALNLGSVTTTRESTLTLGTLDNNSDANSGFAIAVGEFDTVNHRFYVGLLSGTALGAPLDNPTQGGIWNAKIRILTSVEVNPLEADFKLNVDFARKSLKIVNAAGANANINFDIGNASFAFNIDGKFTANGVIYGRVALGASKGTLTGLIGSSGAVGIFNGGVSPYVGGFVAAKTDCTATGTPFHADCTTTPDYDRQAVLCANNGVTPVATVGGDFDRDCAGNANVQARVCAFKGTHANPFNKDICTGAGYDNERARFCFRRNTIFRHFGIIRLAGFSVARDCAGDSVVQDQVCSPHGAYARPFDLQVCPDSDGESVAVRAGLCSNNDERPVTDFNTRCKNSAIRALICIPSGPQANPFDNEICPDTNDSNIMARVQACNDRAITPLPNGVNVGADCARDTAVTDIICTSSGTLANPFDRDICTSNEMTTIGEGDEEKTVLTITIAQSAFVNNCRADNAAGSSSNNAGGADCSVYTDCRDNPFRAACDAEYYEPERHAYVGSLLTYCGNSNRASVTAPVGYTDVATDCVTEQVRSAVCASSGTYANPFDTEVCPAEYCVNEAGNHAPVISAGVCPADYTSVTADIDTIQSEFASACYNVRNDLANNPQCENIATCFESGKIGQNEVSDVGGIPCNGAAIFDVKLLAICNGAISGGTKPVDCALDTITKACTANPFSVIDNGEGINCLGDTALNDRREAVCINDDTNPAFDCTATVTRVCMTDNNPFSDLCYDGDAYENARYSACNTTPIATEITSATAFADKTDLAQNCIDAIDEECIYDEDEQFTNRFCQIGTLYDAARAEACLDDLNANAALCPAVVATYCTANPFDPADDCATGTTYDAARGRACLAGYTDDGSVPTECGNEDTANSYVQAYCATDAGDTNVRDCPTAYATANSTAVTEASFFHFGPTGKNKPLNSDGTGLATVIDAGAGNTANDANANFIVGGQDALVTGLTQTNDGTFRLNELRSDAWMGSGVAVAIAEQKYYVGFLSLTSMGVFLPTANTEITLEWPARLRILRGTTFEAAQDFTLLVELKDQTISVKSGSITTGELFTINDGKFTHNGLLYGGITIANAGAGSLTGLIGRSGGIAIFKSDADADTTYVGGFVTHTTVNCSREGAPFDIICAGNGAERVALAIACRFGPEGTKRRSNDPQCDQLIKHGGTLTIIECSYRPFLTTDGCNTNPAFDRERATLAWFCIQPIYTFALQCDDFPDRQADHAKNIRLARGQLCIVEGLGFTPPRGLVCGDETTAGSYVKDYCGTPAGIADAKNCSIAYSLANPDLSIASVAKLGSRLLKSATDTATVIAEGAGNTANDDNANFIVGGAFALDTGLTQTEVTDLATETDKGIFRFNDLDNRSFSRIGFAVAIAEQKYYVGLLSGTTLGAVLPNEDTETFLDWSAKLRVLRGTTFEAEQDFTLRIELNAKTISVKAGSITAGVFAINDGRFTTDGLLYGTVTVAGNAGTLTGLIGQDGAVGIFKSDVGSASDYVGGFLAADVDCSTDGTPFDVDCTDNEAAQVELALACRLAPEGTSQGTKRRNGDPQCNQFINGVDGLTIIECAYRPFLTTSGCNTNPAFDLERGSITWFCIHPMYAFALQCDPHPNTQAGHQATINAARGGLCVAGGDGFIPPRGFVCGSETTADSLIKAYCESTGGLANLVDCPKNYVTANGDAAEVSVPAIGAGKNQLLNSDGSGALAIFPMGVLSVFLGANFIEVAAAGISPLNLNFTSKTFANGEDGFAYTVSGSNRLYVGLLSDTSLGAPLRNATALSATWDATLTVLSFNGTVTATENQTFKLQVNFGGDTGNTLAIMGDALDFTGPGVFSLTSAKFTQNGVIYGKVNFANAGYGVGTLTGLIGADGVVGIFKSDDTVYVPTASRYVGGFIAVPPADVTAIGFKANALQNNGMDKLIVLDSGAPDTANADTVNFIEGGAVGTGFENATMKISLPINTGGGVAFAYGDSGTANNYHVGILADTNVGPALNNDVTGDWVGKIQAIVNGSDTTEQAITFNVNFGANSFAIKDGTAPTFANIGAMTMDGNFTDTGVIYGSVYFGGANTNTGMLTGLIGQNALVGAFAGNGGLANPYVGGFIANKPTQ